MGCKGGGAGVSAGRTRTHPRRLEKDQRRGQLSRQRHTAHKKEDADSIAYSPEVVNAGVEFRLSVSLTHFLSRTHAMLIWSRQCRLPLNDAAGDASPRLRSGAARFQKRQSRCPGGCLTSSCY